MTFDELFNHFLRIVSDYSTDITEKDKRRAIQIFLGVDEFLIDNLEGYCSEDCKINFCDYASKQIDNLESVNEHP